MTVRCHDFFSCKKSECAMFKEGEKRNCWEIEPALTPCINNVTEGSLEMQYKLSYCKNCLYYEHVKRANP